ncbi:TIGR01777 family oxidoreductase [Shewanella algae]|uniref:TIGR01777 family oxidoreductase n=1 Tax=Shewanella algae TaxID=38313 RepID=UPI0031F54DE7
MNILLTGATGFVGSELAQQLAKRHRLTILSRNPAAAEQKLALAQTRYIDSLQTPGLLEEIDAIINLAGEPIVAKRWSDEQKQRICHSRWDITEQLATLVRNSQKKPQVFLSASAVGFYGRQGPEPIDENATPHDEFSHKVCAQWEQKALAVADLTRVCIFRIGIVLGKDGGALAKMLPAFKLGLGGPIGHGRQGMSWIMREDLLRLIEFLLENEACRGIYNATAPQPVSNRDFSKALGKALHRPACLPAPALALQLAMGEMSTLLTEGQFVLPVHAQADGFEFNYPEINHAMRTLFDKD